MPLFVKLLLDRGDYTTVLTIVQPMLESESVPEVWVMSYFLVAAVSIGDYELVPRVVEQLLNKEPENEWAHAIRGIVKMNERNWEGAAVDLRVGVEGAQSAAWMYENYAIVLEQLGLLEDATNAYLKAFEFDSDDKHLLQLAQSYLNQGMWIEAHTLIQSREGDIEEDLVLYSIYMRAECELSLERFDDCLKSAEILVGWEAYPCSSAQLSALARLQLGELLNLPIDIEQLLENDELRGWGLFLQGWSKAALGFEEIGKDLWMDGLSANETFILDELRKLEDEVPEVIILGVFACAASLSKFDLCGQILTLLQDGSKQAIIYRQCVPCLKSILRLKKVYLKNNDDIGVFLSEVEVMYVHSSREELMRPADHDFPCPMYCRAAYIEGLEREKLIAEQVLQENKSIYRTVFLLRVDCSGAVYGHCNFKKDEEDEYDFKFCETFEVVRDSNLSMLNSLFGVRRFLFSQPDLYREVSEIVNNQGIGAECTLR